MNNKCFLLIIVVLLFLPQVFAFEITDAKLTWNNEDVKFFSHNTPLTVNLELLISADDLDDVVINFSSLHVNYFISPITRDYDSMNINLASCEPVEIGFKCIFNRIVLKKINEEIEIIGRKDSEVSSFSLSLQKSSANPKADFIGTANCHEDICYISSGHNNILLELSGSDAGFSRGMIGFRIGARTGSVSSCEGNECVGSINIQCLDGQSLTASLAIYGGNPSRDNAGRTITGDSSTLVCDSSAPEINNLSYRPARDIGVTPVSETFRVVANVSDSISPTMNMRIIGESVGSDNVTGACVKRNNIFECTASVKANVASQGSYVVPVIFTDAAGNFISQEVTVELVEVLQEDVPNFWSVGRVSQSTTRMNVRNMGFERTFYVEIPLTGDAELLNVRGQTTSCTPRVLDSTGRAGDITKFDIIDVDKSAKKIYARVGLRATGLNNPDNNRYSDFQTLEYNCELDVQTKRGGFFYVVPQKVNASIIINLEKGDMLVDKIYSEIKSTRDSIERSNVNFQLLDQTLNGAMFMCNMLTGVDTVGGLLTSAGTAMGAAGLPFGMSSIGAPAETAGNEINKLTKGQLAGIAKACAYVKCETNFLSSALDSIPGSDFSKYAGRSGYSDFLDPYKSEYVAIAMGCIPAWVHHQKVRQSIECNYLDCLTDGMTSYGESFTYCESERDYSKCVYTSSGVLDAFPPTAILRDVSDRVGDIISDPLNLFGFAAPLACSFMPAPTGEASIVRGACNSLVFVQSIGTLIGTFKGIVAQVESMYKFDPTPQCQVSMDNANKVISSRLEVERQPGHFPEGFDFRYNQPVGANTRLVYDSGSSQFNLVRNVEGQDKVVGIVSPNDVTFKDDRVDVSNSYNIYTPEGRRIGSISRGGIDSPSYNDYNNLVNSLNHFNDERSKIFTEAGMFGWDDSRTMRYNVLLDLADETKEQINNHIFRDFDVLNPALANQLYNNVSSANTQYYNNLINRYPTLGDYFQKEFTARNIYYAKRDEHKRDIEEADAAVSSISVFNNNKNVVEEITQLRDEILKNCVGSMPSKNCIKLQNKIDANINILNTCDSLGLADCTRSNLRSASKDLKKEVRVAEREANKAARIAIREQTFYDHFGSFDKALKTAWGVSSSMSMIRKLVSSISGEDEAGLFKFWRTSFMGEASDWLKEQGQGDWGYCDSEIETNPDESVPIIIKAGAAGHKPGAYLVGRKSSLQTPRGEASYYDYWVEGGIQTVRGGDLYYKVLMIDSSGNREDVTKLVTQKDAPAATRGRPEKFGGLGSNSFRHERNFVRVCVEFSTNSLGDYFDVIHMSGNTICQELVSE